MRTTLILYIIPRQHNDEVQIVVMRVRADGDSRTEARSIKMTKS